MGVPCRILVPRRGYTLSFHTKGHQNPVPIGFVFLATTTVISTPVTDPSTGTDGGTYKFFDVILLKCAGWKIDQHQEQDIFRSVKQITNFSTPKRHLTLLDASLPSDWITAAVKKFSDVSSPKTVPDIQD